MLFKKLTGRYKHALIKYSKSSLLAFFSFIDEHIHCSRYDTTLPRQGKTHFNNGSNNLPIRSPKAKFFSVLDELKQATSVITNLAAMACGSSESTKDRAIVFTMHWLVQWWCFYCVQAKNAFKNETSNARLTIGEIGKGDDDERQKS